MIHLCKLAVGVRDIAHLAKLQAARAAASPPLRHHTRSQPRRAAELCDGGSIYWVVAGSLCVRQRVVDVVPDQWDDGSACTALVLHPDLVPTARRPMKAFQGWRYLAPEAAPPDITAAVAAAGQDELPEALLAELRLLCLL